MARRWQHGSPSSAAQPALASDGAAQPICCQLPESDADEQPAAAERRSRVALSAVVETTAAVVAELERTCPGAARVPLSAVVETTAAVLAELERTCPGAATASAAASSSAVAGSSAAVTAVPAATGASVVNYLGNRGAGSHNMPVYCPTCEIWLNGESQWKDHYFFGDAHRKKITRQTISNGDPDDPIHRHYCDWEDAARAVDREV